MPQRHFSLDDHCLYSVYFAPRGAVRMTVMGMQIAQRHLSAFDRLIGVVGAAAFVLSDMSLACYYFACKIPDRRLFNFPVMILYFGAQVLYVITMITP